MLNKEKKNWIKKYYKIIWELETIADIQLQIQNIIKLADTANNQLANIETTLLQTREIYKTQIGEDIYSISKKLRNIIYKDIEWQIHHIQVLLADKLDQCKDKGEERVDKHIKVLQEAYQETYQDTLQLIVVDKWKQKRSCSKQRSVSVQTICYFIRT